MTDQTDTRLREIVFRVMELAPEAPAFPQEEVLRLEPIPKRRLTPAVWAVAAAMIVLILGGIPFLLRRGGDDPATIPPTTPAPATTAIPGPDEPGAAEFDGRVVVPASADRIIDIYTLTEDDPIPRNLTSNTRPDGYAGYAAYSPDGSRILFEGNLRHSNLQIYVMSADGSGLTRLTDDTDRDAFFPQWSPDGTRIAFVRADEAYGRQPQEIWVMNADGSDPILLSAEDSRGPVWSPDGTTVAFLWRNETWLVPAAGGERIRITELDAYPISWSPDGRFLAVEAARDAAAGGPHDQATDIWIVSADGSEPTRLTSAPGRDWGAEWSPDGNRIVFNSDRDDDTEMYAINADGTGLTRLTEEPGVDGFGRWSPDGRTILFMSERSGSTGLYVMRPDGSGVSPIWPQTSDAAPVWFIGLDWHP